MLFRIGTKISHNNTVVHCVGRTLSKMELENDELPFKKDEFTLGLGKKGHKSDMGNEELGTGGRRS